ncbi:hypothetical protein S40285_08392 [Stachybotrys chlorohalonatus IBT 40285]|uniref:Uncharacterized protein n=1 Tax=Stachybotrys chlorohalonatus (strain IBT 40285) TaxID=1283841 RepID=A0A084QSN4_STAC4|nr:hypothetical protein S40285_08392 [Stachybotrys chlorohalonata IBT 40285]
MALGLEVTPRYLVEHHINSDDDEDAKFVFRRNDRRFYVKVSPTYFVNSPFSTDKYLSYPNIIRSDDMVLGEIYETDVYEWIIRPFQTLLLSLAPEPAGPPKNITLKDYLFPEYFAFELDIINEKPCPRQVFPTDKPHMASTLRLDDDFLDDLETWTAFYDPARIVY